MARRHGWQLPAHSFQVVAITVFFLLSVAFYAFFAPFLGKPIFEYIAEGIYSLLALCVFILYVRCTAIDPADPGILVEPERGSGSAHSSLVGSEIPGNLSTNEEPTKVGLRSGGPSYRHDIGCFSMLCGLLCCFITKEDCRNDDDYLQQQSAEEDALFCTLCNAEVRKMSKHCRSCDKCVDGFDHHCRWLNNCVGRNNYITFICLMAASLLWLVFECAVGIAVLVRCFADKKATEDQIIDRLGDGFSRPPFATIVALSTAVSFLATVPLGELFFFHIILIRKGITTYEYVVAMRTQSEPPGPSLDGGGDQQQQQSLPSSPTGSAVTAVSGRSSVGMGLQYKGAWCTPPRIFMDHQDEIIPHLEPGRLPSTVDPDNVQDKGQKVSSRPVRISAWKLAKLDSNEAIKAGAKARASSSVLRPVGSKPHHYYEHDHLSSTTVSGRSSPTSTKQGNVVRAGTSRSRSSYPPSRASREDVDSLCGGHISNLSSPLASNLSPSPLAHQHNANNNNNSVVSSSRDHFINPIYQSSIARGSEFIENHPLGGLGNTRQAQLLRRSSEESARSSVYWDPEAGRFMSRSGGAASMPGGTELTYTGQSIFFGGPLVGERSGAGSVRPGGGSVSSGQQQRGGGSASSSYYQQGRSQRGGQLPVFVPSDLSSQQQPQQQPQQHQFSSRFE